MIQFQICKTMKERRKKQKKGRKGKRKCMNRKKKERIREN